MLTTQTLKVVDCAGEVRDKLESLKAVLILFCSAYLNGSEESVILAAKANANNMQFAADALITLLCDVLDRAEEAVNAADQAHSMAVSQEPVMEKADVLRAIHKTFSLDDKRQLGEELLRMTAS